MRKRFAVALLSIAFVAALALWALSQEPQRIEGGEPIAFIGHGAIFDTDGNEINVTPQFIREAQKWYLNSLYRQATPNERAIFDRHKKSLFEGVILKGQSELLANSILLFSLLDQVKPQNKCELAGKLRLVEQLLRTNKLSPFNQPISPRNTEEFQPPPEVQVRLRAAQESIAASYLAAHTTNPDGADYIMQCEAAGVPIPPDWGDPLWISKGTLSDEFIKPSQEAEVFTYVSAGRDAPEGACIALPRSIDDTIQLLGIICLGKKSSKACFWDYPGPIKKGKVVPLTSFLGGPDLECQGGGGVCTDCHAGENPFVIHPDTALDLPNLKADDFYKPLVSSNWPQNPGPSTLLDSIGSERQCTECHRKGGSGGRFPNVSTATNGYCTSVLGLAFATQGTMPPDLPGDPRYANHANALRDACKKAP
jgi:hypothetical protein